MEKELWNSITSKPEREQGGGGALSNDKTRLTTIIVSTDSHLLW